MCGGGIGRDAVSEITAYAKQVVWAFDADASSTAIKHHTKYSLYFEKSRVLFLEQDLKDMTEEDLCALLMTLG